MSLETLLYNPDEAIRVEFTIHHAPVYLTALHNGDIASYQSPKMYPSTDDNDVLINYYEDIQSASQLLENSESNKTVSISNTPYSKNNTEPTISPTYGILIQKNVLDKQIDQIILQLQNGEYAVYTPEQKSYIYPHPSKVISNVSTKEQTRVLRSQYSIPQNIIRSAPKADTNKADTNK